MKRIAVIFEGNIYRQLGVFNAVINRAKLLQALRPPYAVDVFMIQGYDSGLNRWLHRTARVDNRPAVIEVDGIVVNVRWFKHRIVDTLAHKLFHRHPPVYRAWLGRLADELKGYDLLSAHDRIAGTAASIANHRHGIPFYITWHGASIYTDPVNDPMYRKVTCELLHRPTCNFFVSKGLENCARQLTEGFSARVLLNGAGEEFQRFDDDTRSALRAERGVAPDTKVVAFVGRMEGVKNVLLLPRIFANIARGYDGKLVFWTIGDGALHEQVRAGLYAPGLNI